VADIYRDADALAELVAQIQTLFERVHAGAIRI